MRASRRAAFLVWTLVACGTDGTTGDPDDGPIQPLPPEGGEQLTTGMTRLAPGEEKYMCYQFYSPGDAAVAITRVDAISMPGVHHIGLFTAFGRDESPEPHECNVLIKQTWLPVFASGTGSPSLAVPSGAGFVIQPGTQYIVQLHLQNATEDALDVRAGLNLTYERDVASLQPAGMFAFGTFDMAIPANTTNHEVAVPDCVTGKQMNVFAVFPHMHKYGTKLTMMRSEAGTAASEVFYEIDPWTFGDQPMDPLEVQVAASDRFDMSCRYNNPTNAEITYGESSDQEMCFFVMFYYPYTGLDGCVQM